MAFVRTRAGSYARPSQCYDWSAQLDTLLGTAGAHWVDEAWMPAGSSGARFQDLLENRLNMRRTPAISHLIDRIQEIAESQNIDAIARDTQPIVRHIRSEEHTSELRSLMRISYAVFCLKKKTNL